MSVFSTKYNVIAEIKSFGRSIKKLEFNYEGRDIEIGLKSSFGVFMDEKEEALAIMENYIEQLYVKEKKTMLHYWHLTIQKHESGDFTQAQGIVTGHRNIGDARQLCSSAVQSINVDWDAEEILIQTRNTLFHCPLEYLDFNEQDEHPELIPDYEEIKEKYKGKRKEPMIEAGNVLVVFSDFDEYYFHSLYYVPEGEQELVKYAAYPHIGIFQDSYLIEEHKYGIDIRYFPHFGYVQFYSEDTNKCPWFIENIGGSTLYFQSSVGTIKLEPGERKEVKTENTEKEKTILPKGNLYVAGVINV